MVCWGCPRFPGELVGRRVVLRPLGAADRGLFDSLYGDPCVMDRVGPPLHAARLATAFEAALADSVDDRGHRRLWRIEAAHAADALGLLGLARSGDGMEVGALLRDRAQGRGHAADAIATLVAAVFAGTGVDRIWARHRHGHAAAAGLMRALGFAASPAEAAPGWCRWHLDRPPSGAAYPR